LHNNNKHTLVTVAQNDDNREAAKIKISLVSNRLWLKFPNFKIVLYKIVYIATETKKVTIN